MTPKRAEPFLVALSSLREGLRSGAFGFERRLTATEIAAQLGLSATPVREALARLAGEGLVEDRRGQGYFVRRLGALDIADLHRLGLAHLLAALEPRGLAAPRFAPPPAQTLRPPGRLQDADEAVAAVDRLFEAWVGAAGGRALAESYRRVQARLGPVRGVERLLIADLAQEAEALLALRPSADRRQAAAAVRAFHRRRVRLADRLAAVLEAPARTIEPI